MDIISARNVVTTPADAIDELLSMRREPWFRRRLQLVKAHLASAQFHGRPLLDVPMSMSAIDAVLKEAWFEVQRREKQEPIERLLDDFKKLRAH